MLVGQLPESSALAAEMRGGRHMRPWTTQTYLSAGVVNLLHAANRQRAHQKTKKPLVSPPKPASAKPKRTVTVAQILARRQRHTSS